MIQPKAFFNELNKNNIRFFAGVPDSLLKDFCAYIKDNIDEKRNIIAANEGNAVALAAGHYLATGEIGLVYMQNSGLGNATNPLLSLIDPMVYNIPVLLLIGWRGEPGKSDEPQHVKQGRVTLGLLEAMEIKYKILPEDETDMEGIVKEAANYMAETKNPYALVVSKNTFSSYKLRSITETEYELNREDALRHIISNIGSNNVIVSTTGKTSRELFELREELNQGHERDFLTVGSMGHSLSMATAIALARPNIDVYCIDGDGALLMHMGGLAVTGNLSPKNLKHIVINNGAHDSVGGQPTAGFNIDMQGIAKASGYKLILQAETKNELSMVIDRLKNSTQLSFLEIRVNKGARDNLGRPTTTPIENKEEFMKFLRIMGKA
ncbi:MAG TPA: phosphonopyruvate decarboxylase [Clostridia bacterium]|nr:phosphonopyruvate decarboxylase [Clostridia bacterium]